MSLISTLSKSVYVCIINSWASVRISTCSITIESIVLYQLTNCIVANFYLHSSWRFSSNKDFEKVATSNWIGVP